MSNSVEDLSKDFVTARLNRDNLQQAFDLAQRVRDNVFSKKPGTKGSSKAMRDKVEHDMKVAFSQYQQAKSWFEELEERLSQVLSENEMAIDPQLITNFQKDGDDSSVLTDLADSDEDSRSVPVFNQMDVDMDAAKSEGASMESESKGNASQADEEESVPNPVDDPDSKTDSELKIEKSPLDKDMALATDKDIAALMGTTDDIDDEDSAFVQAVKRGQKSLDIRRTKEAIKQFFLVDEMLPANIALAIRTEQSLTPEASFLTKDLALQCLTTGKRNASCLYHHTKDKRDLHWNGSGSGKYVLVGIPGKRNMVGGKAEKDKKAVKGRGNIKGKRPDTNPPVTPSPATTSTVGSGSPEALMHCGCRVDDALLDFFFWKTWSLTDVVNGETVTESLLDNYLSPRFRAFFIAEWKKITGLEVDDIYCGPTDLNKAAHDILMTKKMVNAGIKKLNELCKEKDPKTNTYSLSFD